MHYINLKTRGGETITLAEAPSRVEAERLARQYRAMYQQKKYRICVSRRATRTHYEEYGTLQERVNGSQLIESDLSGCLFWLVAVFISFVVAFLGIPYPIALLVGVFMSWQVLETFRNF